MSELIEFQRLAEEAALAAGQILLNFAGRASVREKGPADLVTEADLASQEAIRQAILAAYPDHGFIGEEGAETNGVGRGYCWVVDPLDGTTNYVHGMSNYCVSIALTLDREPVVGVVYDPVGGECFSCRRGGGAFVNARPLAVSNITSLDQALVAASFSAKVGREAREIVDFVEVLLAAQAVRRMGSSALNLCYLAAGRFDAYWGTVTKPWDVAAAGLIAQEAGGVITHYDGGPFDVFRPQFIAASTPELHDELSTILHRPQQVGGEP